MIYVGFLLSWGYKYPTDDALCYSHRWPIFL